MGRIRCRECGQWVSTAAPTCPHCGVPDPIWIPADETASEPPAQRQEPKKEAWKIALPLVALLGIVLFAYLISPAFHIGDGGTPSQSPEVASGDHAGEVRDGRSYGEVLATEMQGRPDAALARRFNQLIDTLGRRCAGDRESISDQILAGHQTLLRQGGRATLLDVAVGWERATQDTGELGVDCTQVLATVLVLLERS